MIIPQTSQPSRFWRKIPAFSLLLRHYDFLPNYPEKKKKKKKKKKYQSLSILCKYVIIPYLIQ